MAFDCNSRRISISLNGLSEYFQKFINECVHFLLAERLNIMECLSPSHQPNLPQQETVTSDENLV